MIQKESMVYVTVCSIWDGVLQIIRIGVLQGKKGGSDAWVQFRTVGQSGR